MGHAKVAQTEHYAKVLPIKVSADMKLLEQRLREDNFLLPSKIIEC
jgi:hypothetical protein